jgi:hypothetical protein
LAHGGSETGAIVRLRLTLHRTADFKGSTQNPFQGLKLLGATHYHQPLAWGQGGVAAGISN